MSSRDVVVIGGGAAGIIAARRAAECGANVTILEKNDRLGLKILISGGGKCNLTHAGSMEEIGSQFRGREALFLKPAFYRFTNSDFLEILHSRGVQSYARQDGRIFPVEPANAKDVVNILTRYVEEAGITIRYETPVIGLVVDKAKLTGVSCDGTVVNAERVILATGGSSYPATGTTGDGWKWAADVGHTLAPLRAALAPLYLTQAKPDWSGIALRDVVLKARISVEGKEIAGWRGDLLFTHKGVSGPAALGISREVAERASNAPQQAPYLEVDLAPSVTFESLRNTLQSEIRQNPRKSVLALTVPYLPSRLIGPFVASLAIAGDTRGAHLPTKMLNKLVAGMKGWSLGTVRHVPLERGEVVAGGVALNEIDPRTMGSRVVEGLYVCGEALDIAGPVGGYNLQAAWSTGFVAGDSAANVTGSS